jgi:hypothetical protein
VNKRQRKKRLKVAYRKMAEAGAQFVREVLKKDPLIATILGPVPILEAPFGTVTDGDGVVHRTGMRPMDGNMTTWRATACLPDGFVPGDARPATVTCLECLSVSTPIMEP